MTVVSAPAGSGKTVLLRSWISQGGLADHAAWVPAGTGDQDPQRFWSDVVGALRRTAPGSRLMRGPSAALDRDGPGLDGWALTERLLTDLAPLDDTLWLVVDDVHQLGPQVLRQLELLVLRAPPGLRLVLATRHDLRLGLHRLRLEGEVAEIRGPDLRFTVAEAAELFGSAGVELPGPELAVLHERTEGWAAGLRLAALSLAGHPDPRRFTAGFSGADRTVAEYLLAEVLDQQSEQARRLLLRTSVLDRVNGELADLLTGGSGGERMLQDLAEANAFVVALDARRSWFRCHHLFAGTLRMQLRRTAPDEVSALHQAAAGWFAANGFGADAVRHAQAARDWERAARLLADHWTSLYLHGQAATGHELLAGFPPGASAADPGLAAVAAADELAGGSLEAAERHLRMADLAAASVPSGRRGQARLLLEIARLLLARQRGSLPAVAGQALLLQAGASAPEVAKGIRGTGEGLRALALTSLGSTEVWAAAGGQAQRHLELGTALARRLGHIYLEFSGLAHLAAAELSRSFERAAEHGKQAIELAEQHGWTAEPTAGLAYCVLGSVLTWQGRAEEAESWVRRAERTIRVDAEPAAGVTIYCGRGLLELVRGRDADALAAFRAAGRLSGRLAAPHPLAAQARALLLLALVRAGQTERAEQVLTEAGDHERAGEVLTEAGGPERAERTGTGHAEMGHAEMGLAEMGLAEMGTAEMGIATAALRLAQGNPGGAAAALAPVLDGSASDLPWTWLARAYLLEAAARDELGDPAAAHRGMERALDLAEPAGALSLFVLHPVQDLLGRHARRGTAHAALIAEIQSLLAGRAPAPPLAACPPLLEALRDSEIRVLRYLPTNLSGPEIASELYISRHTVKTHMRHLYAKLGTHRRADTVARARALGLLASSRPKTQARVPG